MQTQLRSPDISKFRRTNSFPKLSSGERGLIVSSPVTIKGTGLSLGSIHLDIQELRFSLLFWDKLDWPENRNIGVSPSVDEQFLMSAGVLRRSNIILASGNSNSAEIWLGSHLRLYQDLDEQEPGQWCMARGERSISVSESIKDDGRGILFSLIKAVPVPDREVPLQDVLEFKLKRRDELIAFRVHLEETYNRVLGAPDRAVANLVELSKLDSAIADLTKTMRIAGIPTRQSSLSIRLSLGDVLVGAVAAAQSNHFGLSATEAAIAAVSATKAATTVSFEVSYGLTGHRTKGAFEYLSSIHDRLF